MSAATGPHQSDSAEVKFRLKPDIVLRYAQDLLADRTLTENGGVSFPFSSRWSLELQVLGANCSITGFPDRSDVKNLIQDALVELKKHRIVTLDINAFIQAIADSANKILSRPIKEFRIIFALHVRGQWIDDKASIVFRGLSFNRTDFATSEGSASWSRFVNDPRVRTRLSNLEATYSGEFTILETLFSSRSEFEAFERANEVFDVLRSIINIQLAGSRLSERFGLPSAFGICLPPPAYPVFDTAGEHVITFYNTERYDSYRQCQVAREDGGEIERILKDIEALSSDMQSFVVDLHLKYVQALDTNEWRSTFLWLWQTLETIASPTRERVRFSDIVTRLTFLIGEGDELLKHLLETIESARNELVHEGKFSKNASSEISWLKVLTGMAMSSVQALAKDFPDPQSLLDYYRYGSANKAELQRQQRNMDTILRLRG